jgi:hypothetical protein
MPSTTALGYAQCPRGNDPEDHVWQWLSVLVPSVATFGSFASTRSKSRSDLSPHGNNLVKLFYPSSKGDVIIQEFKKDKMPDERGCRASLDWGMRRGAKAWLWFRLVRWCRIIQPVAFVQGSMWRAWRLVQYPMAKLDNQSAISLHCGSVKLQGGVGPERQEYKYKVFSCGIVHRSP